VPIVLKSGSFNLLEPSGPVQACNGIALPLLLLSNSDNGGHSNNTQSSTENLTQTHGKLTGITLLISISTTKILRSKSVQHTRTSELDVALCRTSPIQIAD